MPKHSKSPFRILASLLIGLCCHQAMAQFDNLSGGSGLSGGLSDSPFLPVTEAFLPNLYLDQDSARIEWYIEPGYYLYRNRFAYQNQHGEALEASYPEGLSIFDEFYQQDLEVYYNQLSTPLNMVGDEEILYLQFQGCAEAGLCYPPTWVGFDIDRSIGAVGYRGQLPSGPENVALGATSSNSGSNAQADGLPTFKIGVFAGLLVLLGATIYVYRKAS